MMDNKEAIEYLRPIADNATISRYAEALETAIRAMEKVESLQEMLSDAISDLKFATGNGCKYCKHFDGDSHCTAEEPCFPNDNWEWRGIQEGSHGQQDH